MAGEQARRVPRLRAGVDVRALPIGPREGYILSRIDGYATVEEIAMVTGMGEGDVVAALERLANFGAVDLPGYDPAAVATAARAAQKIEDAAAAERARAAPTVERSPPQEDGVVLPHDLRKKIDDWFARLDELDHYALLGVPRDADRKAIKSAYYALAALLHPDRYYRKNLGEWKPRMEAVFSRMTVAHDTLAHKERRAEYDAYLGERDRTTAFERALEVDVEIAPIEERPVDPASVRSVSDSHMTAVEAPRSSRPLDPQAVERARREALAKKLSGSARRLPAVSGSTAPGRPPSAPRITPMPPSRPSSSGKLPSARGSTLDAVVASARAAAASGDYATASTRMRIAAKVDERFASEAEALSKQALAAMADAYIKQARYEEAQERWLSAALSWIKAHEGRPDDADVAERAANALRLARRDLHKAARLGELAVRLRPDDAGKRVTLAEVYADAGLKLRARSELDAALRLESRNPRAQALAVRLRE